MDEKLLATRHEVSEVGTCNFCEREHEEVMQVTNRNGLTVKMCDLCINELNQYTSEALWNTPRFTVENTHPLTIIVGINPDVDTVGWWYNLRIDSFTVRDCVSRDEMRELKENIEYRHTEFYVVDNGDDMGNLILKKHTKAWKELLNAQ